MKELAEVTSAIVFWSQLLYEIKEGKVSDAELCFLYTPYKEPKAKEEPEYMQGGILNVLMMTHRSSDKQLSIQYKFSNEMTERIIQVIINELKEKQIKLYKEIKI